MDLKKKLTGNFDMFLSRFPEVDLPVTLTEESSLHFSALNDVFNGWMIHFIHTLEESDFDEFTEFMPCFRLKGTQGFIALVYYRAGLLDYEYTLATFSLGGQLIDKKRIGGTKIQGDKLIRTVTTIDEEWQLFLLEGATNSNDTSFDPSTSHSYNYELLASGEIAII